MNTDHSTLLSDTQMEILKELANASLTSRAITIRAKIIILCSKGMPSSLICEELGISTTPLYKWRSRWVQIKATIDQLEKEKKRSELKKAILNALSDSPRSGAPPQFTEEQVMQIIALACTSPEAEGIPVSHWSCRLLAEHARQLGIVESISYKQINNFLKSGGFKTS